MRSCMFVCYVTMANGRRVSGVINARSFADARKQIRNTVQGANALAVDVQRTH